MKLLKILELAYRAKLHDVRFYKENPEYLPKEVMEYKMYELYEIECLLHKERHKSWEEQKEVE